MKKLVLLFAFTIISLIGNAQNENWGDTLALPAAHQTLLKDGKSWHYRKTEKVSEDLELLRVIVDTTYVNLTVHGDTIIDGQKCWKMYWETADTSFLHNIWLEDGMFVYIMDTEKGNTKNLVFDFTPQKGNHLTDWGQNWYLNTIDAIECWGEYYNRYHYLSTNGSDDGPLLVDGIGTFNGIENRTGAVGGWNSFLFLGCYEGEELIFSRGDFFKVPTSIDAPETIMQESSSNSLYDLSGRRVKNGELTKGVYIQNGKKVVMTKKMIVVK